MPTVLRLVQRDERVPLLLTLRDEHGNEMDSDTALSGEAAIKCAIMLLSRQRTPRPSSLGAAVPGMVFCLTKVGALMRIDCHARTA
jgi:hypothetical protein